MQEKDFLFKVGFWTVLNKDESGSNYFLCRCICGKEEEKSLLSLKSAKCSSCYKCYVMADWGKEIDWIGHSFFEWTVLKKIAERNVIKPPVYLAQCSCGNLRVKKSLAFLKFTRCKECLKRDTILCSECKCVDHKDIDLNTSKCELIGFCEKCDGWKGWPDYLGE